MLRDDVVAIPENQDVTGGRPWTEAFRRDFWGEEIGSRLSHKSYRPLTVLAFRAIHSLFGYARPAALQQTQP